MNIREARQAMTRVEQLVASEGEIIITRHGRPVAKLVPVHPRRAVPSHASLRAALPPQEVPSEILVAQDRDAR